MNPNLFVYGSLMSSHGHPNAARLAREGRSLGPATIGGRLYRVNWYPGLVESDVPTERVHGEVYELADPTSAFVWLDAYEGLTPGSAKAGEYERVERVVQLATGANLVAQVYLYRWDAAGLPLEPDGRWQPHAPFMKRAGETP